MQFVDSLFAFPRPRQAAHFLWTFAIIMSLRLLFHGCAPIPGALEIHPGLAMIPVAGIQFGAAGVLGASAAAFVSDLVLKTPGTACRVIGYGLCAFLPFLVWNGLARETAGASKRSGSARALIACLAGGFAISTWGPINAVAQGVHQFAFLALCQFLVFLVYLVVLFPVFASQAAPTVPSRNLPVVSAAWLGGFLSLASGILVGGFLYGGWPWADPPLGRRDGWMLWIALLPGAALQWTAIASWAADRRRNAHRSLKPRFGSLYISPIKKG